MKRKQFLSLVAMGATAGIAMPVLDSCSKSSNLPSTGGGVDFTIDLNNSSYTALNSNGGYVLKNGVIIARLAGGNIVALSSTCTHAGCTVNFDGSSTFPCPCHGSVFSSSGSVLNGPAFQPLTRYNTQLSGTSLRIYS